MRIQYKGDLNGNGVTTYETPTGAMMMPSSSMTGDGSMKMMFPWCKPPPSTTDSFIFAAEMFGHMPDFKMFPEYITASLPDELSGKIKESEWDEWMEILKNDRESHACGDSVGCAAISICSVAFACYPCFRSSARVSSMKKFIEKINNELFIPRGMFLKQQEGYIMGVPMIQGSPQCSWFTISLNQKESIKLRKEPKRVPLTQ